MRRSRSLERKVARAVARHLMNCDVELGNSAALARELRAFTDPAAVVEDGGETRVGTGYSIPFGTEYPSTISKNIVLRGIFRTYHEEVLDIAGHQPSVTIPAIVPNFGTETTPFLQVGDRFAVRLDDSLHSVRPIFRLRAWEPDGQHKALCYLHLEGFSAEDIQVHGYPHGYGSAYACLSEVSIDRPNEKRR